MKHRFIIPLNGISAFITEITRNDVYPLSSSGGLGLALCEMYSGHVGIRAAMWKVEEVLDASTFFSSDHHASLGRTQDSIDSG